MKKNKIRLFFLILLGTILLNSYSQNLLVPKVYSYTYKDHSYSYFFYETIELLPNGYFFYKNYVHMGLKIECEGYWEKKDSFLILNSIKKTDKMIVNEGKVTKRQQTIVNVVDMQNIYFPYTLFAITLTDDTLIFKNQYKQTKIKKHIKSLWLIDSKGLISPHYNNIVSNIINIKFQSQRIFDNEKWIIKNDSCIVPIGLDGALQRYALKKEILPVPPPLQYGAGSE